MYNENVSFVNCKKTQQNQMKIKITHICSKSFDPSDEQIDFLLYYL